MGVRVSGRSRQSFFSNGTTTIIPATVRGGKSGAEGGGADVRVVRGALRETRQSSGSGGGQGLGEIPPVLLLERHYNDYTSDGAGREERGGGGFPSGV